MINYDQLEQQLERHEGIKLKPYRCTAGKLTIGVGRNLEDNGLSEYEAKFLLQNDISRIEEELRRRLPSFRRLSGTRQAVLVNMAFNLGVNGLLNFRKMLNAMEYDDFAEAALELLDSNYADQVGVRAYELSRQLESGEWQ